MANILAVRVREGDWTSLEVRLTQVGQWEVALIGIPTAEYEDAARTIMLALDISNDPTNAETWWQKYAMVWKGGHSVNRIGEVNAPPRLTVDLTPYRQQYVRVRGSVPIATTFGIDLTRL
jgi:hypothetical protein